VEFDGKERFMMEKEWLVTEEGLRPELRSVLPPMPPLSAVLLLPSPFPAFSDVVARLPALPPPLVVPPTALRASRRRLPHMLEAQEALVAEVRDLESKVDDLDASAHIVEQSARPRASTGSSSASSHERAGGRPAKRQGAPGSGFAPHIDPIDGVGGTPGMVAPLSTPEVRDSLRVWALALARIALPLLHALPASDAAAALSTRLSKHVGEVLVALNRADDDGRVGDESELQGGGDDEEERKGLDGNEERRGVHGNEERRGVDGNEETLRDDTSLSSFWSRVYNAVPRVRYELERVRQGCADVLAELEASWEEL
jgi:hypothetical protein